MFQLSSRSLTKTTGELHISFPAGITRAFTSHPNPPILSFRIPSANTNVISNITHDTLLVRLEFTNGQLYTHLFSPILIFQKIIYR